MNKIGDVLLKIITEYPESITQPIANHSLANYMRRDASKIIKDHLPERYKKLNYKVKCSPGQGDNWVGLGDSTSNPWLGIFNQKITKGTSRGYFVAYGFLFRSNEIGFGIGQSEDEIRKRFGKKNIENRLNGYAEIMLNRLNPETYFKTFTPRNLLNNKSYFRSGVVLHKTYNPNNLPSEKILRNDLNLILDAYEVIFQSGGRGDLIDINIQDNNDDADIVFRDYVKPIIQEPDDEEEKKAKSGNKKKQLGYNNHKKMEIEISNILRENGFHSNQIEKGPDVDICWKTKNGISIVEVKSINENERKQIRSAIGQISEYKYKLEEKNHKVNKCYIAVSSEPKSKLWKGLIESLGFNLITPKNINKILDS